MSGTTRTPAPDEAETIAFRDGAEFEAWLESHADRQAGVWLKLAKQGSGIPSLTADEAVDIGLCFGWISGQRRSLDEVHYLQKYVPRRPRSRWSQVNVAKVRGADGGGAHAAVAAWPRSRRRRPTAAGPPPIRRSATATVPPDLAAVLAASPQAAQAFAELNKTDRYGVIHKLLTARSTAARETQLQRAIAALSARDGDVRARRG